MASADSAFQVRPASLASDDVGFILAAWDSTLPFLASVGAGAMWGDQPFSQREGQEQEVISIIRGSGEAGDSGNRRFLVTETRRPGDEAVVQVGAALIRDTLPKYLTEHVDLNGLDCMDSLLYLEVLIADHRPQRRCKGAGKALIDALRRQAQSTGADAIYVDVWAGNERKLNRQVRFYEDQNNHLTLETRYYEGLGFTMVADFELKRRDGSSWPGTLYRMNSGPVT